MNIITLDFETYYDNAYSLKKLTTEDYIRNDLFECIGVGTQIGDGKNEWFSGTHKQTKDYLHSFDWRSSVLVAHNASFDASILNWRFGISPYGIWDTLSMARAIHGIEVGNSLATLAERYKLGVKGKEVVSALGKRIADFTEAELAKYGEYCKNDVDLTYRLLLELLPKVSTSELKIIDITTRMFSEPMLELDILLLEQHYSDVKERKNALLEAADANKDVLMSNPKFADLLRTLGVDPPMKISLATGLDTYAFAKSDEEFKELLEHPDERVQALVAARLGTKSTLEETRTERFLNIAKRGSLPVPLRYYAARTGRWGGEGKLNLQNLPARGTNALKNAILAPDGYVIIDCDSSQIEARVLAWLSGQTDLVEAFAKGEDVYKIMASSIYNKPVEDIVNQERFVGKTTILGCIAKGTLVLSSNGWKPIERITLTDKLWDGKEWVCHQGLVKKGIKKTLSVYGAWLTPDHKILCGTTWKETQLVVLDESMQSLALGIGAENLPLRAMLKGFGGGWWHLLSNVIVGHQSIRWITTILKTLKVPDVIYALKNLVLTPVNYIGGIVKSSQMIHTAKGCLTAFQAVLLGATLKLIKHSPITEGEEFLYMKSGKKIGLNSYSTLYCSHIGMTPSVTSTASTTTKGMNPEIYDLQLGQKTLGINEKSKSCNRNLMTYDIALAGPRNRFTIATDAGPIIVHNCGYGMGAEKFQTQLLGFGVSLPLAECTRIIEMYRETYDAIPLLWKQADKCLRAMVQNRVNDIGVQPQALCMHPDEGFLFPSGYYLPYPELEYSQKKGYTYKTRKGYTKIYGGKVVENLCQAIARCIIGEQMIRINRKYRVVLTVHDAVASVVREEEAVEAQQYIESCMRWVPSWATGLPLNCESGVGKSYGEC